MQKKTRKRKGTRTKNRYLCMVWFHGLTEQEKGLVFEGVVFKVCKGLMQGYSIHMSKAIARRDLQYGYELIDYVCRHSLKLYKIRKLLKIKTVLGHNANTAKS